jgi:hypothetical protein
MTTEYTERYTVEVIFKLERAPVVGYSYGGWPKQGQWVAREIYRLSDSLPDGTLPDDNSWQAQLYRLLREHLADEATNPYRRDLDAQIAKIQEETQKEDKQ